MSFGAHETLTHIVAFNLVRQILAVELSEDGTKVFAGGIENVIQVSK